MKVRLKTPSVIASRTRNVMPRSSPEGDWATKKSSAGGVGDAAAQKRAICAPKCSSSSGEKMAVDFATAVMASASPGSARRTVKESAAMIGRVWGQDGEEEGAN